jgi:rubrerythrin
MWAIHNALRNWTLYGLSEREVQLIMNTLSANELKLISLCNSRDMIWHPLDSSQNQSFMSAEGKDKRDFPEPIPRVEQILDAQYFVIRPKKVILPRLHDRIEIELDVMIEGLSRSQHFKSQTIDLSEGGIHFKDLITDWVSGYFIVIISHQEQSYQIMCALVEDQKIKHRVQVMSEENDSHYVRYKNFLDELRNL